MIGGRSSIGYVPLPPDVVDKPAASLRYVTDRARITDRAVQGTVADLDRIEPGRRSTLFWPTFDDSNPSLPARWREAGASRSLDNFLKSLRRVKANPLDAD